MKLLILGASDSEGTLLPNFADSWREQLRTRLPALIGEPVEIDHRRFYIHLPGCYEHVEKCLAESNPDFVIMACTGYAFSTASVGNRLRRTIGPRMGTWLERRANAFDRWTAASVGSPRDRLNVIAHKAAGKTIGRDPIAPYDFVFSGYVRCIERLARTEDLDAIIMGTTYNGPVFQRRLPGMKKLVDRFNVELRQAAEAHRFGWVNRQTVINALPIDTTRPDQLHAGADIHAGYAAALIPLIVSRRSPPA